MRNSPFPYPYSIQAATQIAARVVDIGGPWPSSPAQVSPKLEIQLHGRWLEVNDYIFRSWGGPRRKNGKRYQGPVYYLGTDKVFEKPEVNQRIRKRSHAV